MSQVERIGVLNNGIFQMNFTVQWRDSSGSWQAANWDSGKFDNGLYVASPPLLSIGVPANATEVAPYVTPFLGLGSKRGTPSVQPANNGKLAAYEVVGTTFSFTVTPLPWKNWAQNVVHTLTIDRQGYFIPKSRADLQAILAQAVSAGVTVRISGQRHAQPPLVADDNRSAPSPKQWIVDLSCYKDLGDGSQSIVLNAAQNTVTVNTGVREDELDAFLTRNDMMLKTVTAGGFFSLGGMTAVDVHGATLSAPIFAETVSAFTIMGPDGQVKTIDAQTPKENGWSPLQFARASFGALGIVTSVTVDVLPRPWATTLSAGRNSEIICKDENAFIAQFKPLLSSHDRVEAFLNPYSYHFMALWWDVVANPKDKIKNLQSTVPDACTLAASDMFGAPYLVPLEPIIEWGLIKLQYSGSSVLPAQTVETGLTTVEGFFDTAAKQYSDLWLTKASRVIFMSYFIEMPDLDDAGLAKTWKGLNAVIARIQSSSAFLPVAPLEFRFIRGGDSALSGAYSQKPNVLFANLDLIGYVEATPGSQYPAALLEFFAHIERAWVALGGAPHGGKMYGFYDPDGAPGSFTAPFNPAFVKHQAQLRGARTTAFDAYRVKRDPKGMFSNAFVNALLGH